MHIQPLIFMLAAWGFVLGLTVWCFHRLLRGDGKDGDSSPPQD